jgi:hypothetical protein
MKSRKSSLILHSFEDLKDLPKTKLRPPARPADPGPRDLKEEVKGPELDDDLFAKAMEGVSGGAP